MTEDPNDNPVLRVLTAWLHEHPGQALPEPFDRSPERATRWWQDVMTEVGIAPREAASNLATFLRMERAERLAVVDGVLGDLVPYRGDTFAFYRAVVDEAHRMRAMGAEAYRKHAVASVKGLLRTLN